jgi:hypothetical protein
MTWGICRHGQEGCLARAIGVLSIKMKTIGGTSKPQRGCGAMIEHAYTRALKGSGSWPTRGSATSAHSRRQETVWLFPDPYKMVRAQFGT